MKGDTRASTRGYVERKGGEEAADNQLSKDVLIGDIIWVKLKGSSWWPAQVVDENTVSRKNKPSDKSVGEVLVRLYGSYKYLYVDFLRCRSEFVDAVNEYNGNCSEIMKETLKQDLALIKSGHSKRQGSITEAGIAQTQASQDKITKQNTITVGQKMGSPTSVVVSPKMSTKKRPTKGETVNLLSEKPNEPSSRKRKQDLLGKLEPNSSITRRSSPRLLSAAGVAEMNGKNGNPLSQNISEEKSKNQMQDGLYKKVKPNNMSPVPTLVEKPQESSARKMKVMQSLGLTAPSGSPFDRNKYISPSEV